jgi:lysophospholipase L1-like esterase
MTRRRIFLAILVLAAAFAAGAVSYRIAVRMSAVKTSAATASPPALSYYDVRRGLFELAKVKSGSVVMLGDSITEQELWSEWTGCSALVNRGIGGDTAASVLARLDDVIRLKPRLVYLLIGVNDIRHGRRVEATAQDIRAILQRLRDSNIDVIWIPTLPTSTQFRNGALNPAIAKLNEIVAWPDSLDIRSQMTGGDGNLRPELTYDGIHLTAKADFEIASRIRCDRP